MTNTNKEGMLDGQPNANFYAPSVMGIVDVIANILERFDKAGVVHKFQGNDLIITAVELAHDSKEAEENLTAIIKEVVSYLREEYKETVGKALSLGKEEWRTLDVTPYYATNKSSLFQLSVCYNLPELKAMPAPEEQSEMAANIPVADPKNK